MSEKNDTVQAISAKVAAARAFMEEMQAQGIHLGWGSPPVCIVCGVDWPCMEAAMGEPYTVPCDQDQ